MSILGAIANPQMADIAGALDIRQKRLDADEAKRKEIRMGQLIAEALPNIRPDSPLYEMAQTSPREFAVFAKALGIPLNAGDKMQEMANDVGMLYTLAQDSPEAAFQQALDIKDERNQAGMETPQLDKWIEGMREDPQRGMTALFLMHRSINGQNQNKPAGLVEFEGMTAGLGEEDKEKARRVALGLDPRAVGSAAMTTATTGLTDQVAESESTIKGSVKQAQTTAAGNTGRAQDFISTGVSSAEAIPNIKRAITLLDGVKTGGFNAAAARARQTLGIEGADEGELSANLGKAVLSQLRQTFGAAFTEKEGERLEKIEASFGRSAEANKRILAQTLQLLETKAKRGLKAAEDQGDDFAIQDINNYLNMSLDPVKTGSETKTTKSQPSLEDLLSKY